jgi:sugar phosphate permease
MNNHHHGKRHRALTLSCLVLAGESIFIPPFHLNRYFKSSLLDAFGLDELELGKLFAVYGVSAMACYFLGGPLADRFSPRKLLPASLIATGMGSVYMSTIPSLDGLYALYTFWGVSTIFAFWAPLIRATREWGGEDRQGRGFGILDGGRGLVAAVLASGAAYTFTAIVGDAASPDVARETTAVRTLLYAYTGVCIVAAVCIWYFVPDPDPPQTRAVQPRRLAASGGHRGRVQCFQDVRLLRVVF